MSHWNYQEHLQHLAKKVIGLRRGVKRADFIPVLNASVVSDEQCVKNMLSINSEEINRISVKLEETGNQQISKKLSVWLCYLEQLKFLAELNIRELVGLTRDDVATIQRVVVTKPVVTGKRREELLGTIMELMSNCAESEILDKDIEEMTCDKSTKAIADDDEE